MTEVMTAEAQQAPGPAAEQASGAVPPIVDRPCRHYGPNALSWPEHPELESFMRATYEAHVARSCRSRAFEPSVPETDLAEVAKGKYLRRDAAPLAIRMLDDARDALRQAKAAGDAEALAIRSFGISSAYRSALRQYRLWNDRFGGYMADTAQQRTGLPGGPVGDEAAQWLARWIGGWLAAPGFSNHNDGRAIDLFCRLTSGRVLTADRGDIPRWRTSWLHQWLTANAAHYDFYPYLKEPWHWEHRPGSASAATLARPRPAAESTPKPWPRLAAGRGSGSGVIAAGPGAAAYWRSQLRFGLAGNTVEPLIDGPAAFRAIQGAIESADDSTHFIYLLGWWTDPWVNLTGPGTCLLDLFARAGARGVQVRVLVWDAPWGFARHQSNLATRGGARDQPAAELPCRAGRIWQQPQEPPSEAARRPGQGRPRGAVRRGRRQRRPRSVTCRRRVVHTDPIARMSAGKTPGQAAAGPAAAAIRCTTCMPG